MLLAAGKQSHLSSSPECEAPLAVEFALEYPRRVGEVVIRESGQHRRHPVRWGRSSQPASGVAAEASKRPGHRAAIGYQWTPDPERTGIGSSRLANYESRRPRAKAPLVRVGRGSPPTGLRAAALASSQAVISPRASWPACSWRRKALTMSSVSSSMEVSATRVSTVT